MDHHRGTGGPPLQPKSEDGGNYNPLPDPWRPSGRVLAEARVVEGEDVHSERIAI